METKDLLERFIEREKAFVPLPGSEKRIMARIREEGAGRFSLRANLLHISAIAASIAVATLAGIAVGESYGRNANGLVINDTHIERLSIYTEYVDE